MLFSIHEAHSQLMKLEGSADAIRSRLGHDDLRPAHYALAMVVNDGLNWIQAAHILHLVQPRLDKALAFEIITDMGSSFAELSETGQSFKQRVMTIAYSHGRNVALSEDLLQAIVDYADEATKRLFDELDISIKLVEDTLNRTPVSA